jgi:apolipoprotein N-acyltransferase
MDRLANSVILSWGWRRRILAMGAGALSALAMPPFFAFPILWLTLPVLVWLIDGAVAQARSGRVRRIGPAFAAGWWFGFGYFLAGLWWVGAAFLVEADEFGWLMPIAVIALPAGLALFWGFGAAIAQLLWSEDWRRIFALAAGLGSAEWLRGHLLTGFPWNTIGYALTAGEILMQSAALVGIYGLSIAAVAIFAAPAALAPAIGERHRNVALPALSIAALCALGLYGVLRLADGGPAFVPNKTIRIVQPALGQLQKWDAASKDEVLSTYFRLSAPDGAPLREGTLLVWPESAFPFPLTAEPGVLAAIAELLPEGTMVATGAYREELPPAGDRRIFNAIYAVGADGTIQSAYDKVHLVPFGEYLPAADPLERLGLRQIAFQSFSPGPARRLLELPFGPSFVPLICYEAIFSGAIWDGDQRPGFMLNVTNDGWFGRTTGPYQHYHQARVRSVEEGLPLVRAANTGISAIVDAYGRVQVSAGLGEATMIEGPLPAAIDPPPFARWRDSAFLLLLAACFALSVSKYFHPVSRR